MPIGLIGRVGAAEHVERLFVIAGLRQRAAVFTEYVPVVWILHRQAFEHGDRLRALGGGPQRLGVVQRDVDLGRIGVVLRAVAVEIAPPGRIRRTRRARRRGRR